MACTAERVREALERILQHNVIPWVATVTHEEFLSLAALIAAELDTTNPKEH